MQYFYWLMEFVRRRPQRLLDTALVLSDIRETHLGAYGQVQGKFAGLVRRGVDGGLTGLGDLHRSARGASLGQAHLGLGGIYFGISLLISIYEIIIARICAKPASGEDDDHDCHYPINQTSQKHFYTESAEDHHRGRNIISDCIYTGMQQHDRNHTPT